MTSLFLYLFLLCVTHPLNPPPVRGTYILWLSGMVYRSAQIFAKSSKNGFENRTPRSTREVRENFSFFVPYSLCDRLTSEPRSVSRWRCGRVILVGDYCYATICLWLIFVFENKFSANINQTQTIYDCNRLLRSAQTCCDRSTPSL